jgi:hypothetical protein
MLLGHIDGSKKNQIIEEEANQVHVHTKSMRQGAKACPPSPLAGYRPALRKNSGHR